MRWMEFKTPVEGNSIIINLESVISIHNEGFDRTEIRVTGNSYMVQGTLEEIKHRIRRFGLQEPEGYSPGPDNLPQKEMRCSY